MLAACFAQVGRALLVSAFQAREPCTPDAFMCAPTQGRLGVQAEQFSYCQPWMLAWGYRKQNLVAELVSYNADIMCLQVGNAVNQIMHAHLTS